MTGQRVIPRSEWGSRYGRGRDVSNLLPWDEVVIHTEAGAVRPQDWPAITAAAWTMSLTEQQHVQAVERYHSVTLGWDGAGYSFLFSRDGSIFEGRGWGRSGAHTEDRNSTAAGFCFLGHGDLQPATEAQWLAAEWLIREGIRLGKLRARPKITGHRNYSRKGKTCPGNLIYPHIGRLRGLDIIDTTGSEKPTNPKELSMSQVAAIVDALRPKTWRHPKTKRVYIVSPAGKIYVPNQTVLAGHALAGVCSADPPKVADGGWLDSIPEIKA